MRFDEPNDNRVNILNQIMQVIAFIYCQSQSTGKIKSIKYLNADNGPDNVDATTAAAPRAANLFSGVTRIGTELEKKILTPLVQATMTRPLLVMVITDGDVSV